MKRNIFIFVQIIILFTSCIFFDNKTDLIWPIEFQPFAKNTRAVRLSEPSTLQLNEFLPRLDGATALYPLFAAFVQAVYPEGDYEPFGGAFHSSGKVGPDLPLVTVNGTAYAYRNLIEGNVDIIFVAGPSIEQIKLANEKGVELFMTPIGREAFVFFVI